MATLEKIRTRAGVFISVIIGIALISFIINPEDIQRYFMMGSSKNSVGKIAGETIPYMEYRNRLDAQTDLYKLMSGNDRLNIDEQTNEQLRNVVWDSYIRNYILHEEYKKVGIALSDDEFIDMIIGDNPVQSYRQLFTNPQTGVYERGQVIQFMQNVDQLEPFLRARLLYEEEQAKEGQLFAKLSNLIGKSAFFNSVDLNDAINNAATSVEFSYVVKPYMVVDTISKVSNSDLQKYYNEHKKLYEQTRSRDIQFVNFPIRPSADDYRYTMEKLQRLEAEFINTPVADLGLFVNRNSDKPFDDIFYKKSDFSVVVDSFAFSGEVGDFLPIYQEENSYRMARISAIRNIPDSVNARHILLSPENFALADSLVAELKKGVSFAEMAQQYSIDQVANQSGGDVGWFAFRDMVRPFSDSCFYTPKGTVTKVYSQYGMHIIEILDQKPAIKHVQMAVIQLGVSPSKSTTQGVFNQANSIVEAAKNDQNKFYELVAEKGLQLQPANRIGLNDRRVVNYTNVRELIHWLYDAKMGDVLPEAMKIDDNYVIATVTGIREDGIAPFEQVKSEIEVAVKREKQADLMAQELKSAMQSANGIDDLASKVNLQIMNVTNPVSFTTSYISGIMMPEPQLVGAVTNAAENTLSGPVKGQNGVYVFTVTNKEVSEIINKDTELIRLNNTIPMQTYELYNILLKAGNIVDDRGNFF